MWQQQQEVTVLYSSPAFHCSQEHVPLLFYLPHSVLLGFALCVDTACAGPLVATAVGQKFPVVSSLDHFSFSLAFSSQFSQPRTLLQRKLLCSCRGAILKVYELRIEWEGIGFVISKPYI